MAKFTPLLENSQCGNRTVLYIRNGATMDDLIVTAESRCEAALRLLELLDAGDYRATHVSPNIGGIALLISDALSLYQMAFDRIGRK